MDLKDSALGFDVHQALKMDDKDGDILGAIERLKVESASYGGALIIERRITDRLEDEARDLEARIAELEARLSAKGDQKFLADDGNGNREGHDTLEGARACANLAIAHWQSEAKSSDGEWSKCVMHVTVWAAIERAHPEPGDDEGGVDFFLRPIPVIGGE